MNKNTTTSNAHSSGHHLGDTVPLNMTQAKRRLNVFLVEDDGYVRDVVRDKAAFSRIKIVGHADTAAAANVILRDMSCDVVILDLELKQGTGFQVLRELRSRSDSWPCIIVFTNFIDPHFRTQTMDLGANYFLDKALGTDSLLEIIEGFPASKGGGSN